MKNLRHGGQRVEGETPNTLNGKMRPKSRKSDFLTLLIAYRYVTSVWSLWVYLGYGSSRCVSFLGLTSNEVIAWIGKGAGYDFGTEPEPEHASEIRILTSTV
jgi:hypothetical protein